MAEPPKLATERVAESVVEQFGLCGEYTELVSERDQNFCLTSTDGLRFVVKVTCLVQEPVVTDFQIAALLHLESRGIGGVPRIVRTLGGNDRGVIHANDESDACLRVVSWVEGKLLDDCQMTPTIAEQFGRRLAELDIAFQDFSHPGESQELLWDTQRAGELREFRVHVDDPIIRDLLETVFDDFDQKVEPVLASLPSQVIHNDAHGENILVDADDQISGIIDFGDMLRAPRVIEVSIAAAYMSAGADDPLEFIAPFVAAYCDTIPLQPSELELLFDLTRTRILMTVILFYWRLVARPKDDPYRQKLLVNEGDSFRFLQRLSAIGRDAFLERISRK